MMFSDIFKADVIENEMVTEISGRVFSCGITIHLMIGIGKLDDQNLRKGLELAKRCCRRSRRELPFFTAPQGNGAGNAA